MFGAAFHSAKYMATKARVIDAQSVSMCPACARRDRLPVAKLPITQRPCRRPLWPVRWSGVVCWPHDARPNPLRGYGHHDGSCEQWLMRIRHRVWIPPACASAGFTRRDPKDTCGDRRTGWIIPGSFRQRGYALIATTTSAVVAVSGRPGSLDDSTHTSPPRSTAMV